LTANYGTTHGAALAMLLPAVVRWNKSLAAARYTELSRMAGLYSGDNEEDATEVLAGRLEQLAATGGLQSTLSAAGVPHDQLSMLAGEAAKQWTGGFNPRPFDQAGALEVYQSAF
jgi:alcohol dehydrogenase class IV